jgi:ATP-dependent Lon protease
MTTALTRDEYQRYLKAKEKLLLKDEGTQTDLCITQYNRTSFSSNDYENETDDRTSEESVNMTLGSKTTSQSQSSSSNSSTKSSQPTETSESDSQSDVDEDDESERRRSRSRTPRKRRYEEDMDNGLDRVRAIFSRLKKRRYANPEDEDFYQSMNKDKRAELTKKEDAIYDMNTNKVPLRFKILQSDIDDKLKSLCLKKLDQLDSMTSHSDEYFKLLQWVESVAKLPINKYKSLPITSADETPKIAEFLSNTRNALDNNVYGHKDTKEHIVRLLAKWISNKDAKGLVIGLEGPMGTGKTSICLEVCNALGLPSGFISLGGLSSSEYLLGHSYTYEGSKWGKIAEVLMHAEYANPVLFFDELDKVSTSRHGEEIINTLIHITDVTQNHNFRDKYFSEVPLDLSRCIIIFSYNNGELVNPILKDRMVTIKASGYSQKDKIVISKKHMIPKILKEYAFQPTDLEFDDNILQHIISVTDEEDGVRKLKRSLEDIVSNLNVYRLLNKPLGDEPLKFPLKITEQITKQFVSKKEKHSSQHHMMYI